MFLAPALGLLGLGFAPAASALYLRGDHILDAQGQSNETLRQLSIGDFIPALRGCYGFDCVQRYVAFDDKAFSWNVVHGPELGETEGVSWRRWELALTSQAWMNSSTLTAWTHKLFIVVPDTLGKAKPQAGWGTMSIVQYPSKWQVEAFAARTGAVAAMVTMVPNQGLSFRNEGRYLLDEETLKAWSWVQYANHPMHPEWPVEMPNVKAVVRAMDATQEFLETLAEPDVPQVQRFIVTGASKRGIATWMTGAVDPRVAGLMPLVINLNQDVVTNNSASNLGGLGAAVLPYLNEGVYDVEPEAWDRVEALIDPWFYKERFTMPKYVVNAGNDCFFAPDASSAWYYGMPEPKSFFLSGNAQHGDYNVNPDLVEPASAFALGLMLGLEVPSVTWSISNGTGAIAAQRAAGQEPVAVKLWSAETKGDGLRDFRDAKWEVQDVQAGADGRWHAELAATDGRWRGFYLEFEYRWPEATSKFLVSTEASVVPQIRPFEGASPRMDEYRHIIDFKR